MPVPAFDHNLVLPPHLGDPTSPDQLSPYPCSTAELCKAFGTSRERRAILSKFLDFRERLGAAGLTNGFQWLDGSFLEDIESRENRPPGDLDAVTVYWGYDLAFQTRLSAAFPEFANPMLCRSAYLLHHFPIDASHTPEATLEASRYWILLFSHNRLGNWKGMLKIDLNTPMEDAAARQELARCTP